MRDRLDDYGIERLIRQHDRELEEIERLLEQILKAIEALQKLPPVAIAVKAGIPFLQ